MKRSLAKSPAELDGFGVGGGGVERRGTCGALAPKSLVACAVKLAAVGWTGFVMIMARASSAFQPARRGMWACLPAA